MPDTTITSAMVLARLGAVLGRDVAGFEGAAGPGPGAGLGVPAADARTEPPAARSDGPLLVGVTREELRDAAAALVEMGGRHLMLVAFGGTGPGTGCSARADSGAGGGAGSGAATGSGAGSGAATGSGLATGSGAGLGIEEILAIAAGPIVRLRVDLAAGDPTYPSITPLLTAAQWDERECHDLHGIVPAGHPDLRPLVHHVSVAGPAAGSPASGSAATPAAAFRPFVAHGDGVYQLPVGPIHAGVIEPGHFRFSAVGESVLYLDARLFYTHRGIERLVEGRTFTEALPIVERACGVCTVTHATAFSQAVESLTGTAVPPRARLARVLLAEMERLYNHVGDLGNICAGVGFNFGTSRLGLQKERLLRLNEAVSGHRYLMGVVAPGGLRLELDETGLAALGPAVAEIEHEVRSVVRHLVRSDSLMNRLHGTGVLSHSEALRLGALGVAARASGVPVDLRRDRPVDGYRDVEVAASGASAGDVAARFHVRAQEAAVSAVIIADLAARLPSGARTAILAGEPRTGDVALAGVEGPRGASWLWLMAGPGGRIARLHLRSASFANWPIVAAVVPGNIVPDFPVINKSFELCYACTDR